MCIRDSCTIDPNVGVVAVPDERLKLLADLYHSAKVTPAAVSYTHLDVYKRQRLESIDPYICDALKSKTTTGGYIQLLPGIHESDGFFIARLRRLEETEEVQGEEYGEDGYQIAGL